MEDDALVKKNTDCVYFLASPLTCKKGNDCEFRHSETARVNPRDCRYWLGGNCLNWDCPFRHPPLEGRPAVASAAAPGPVGAAKSRVPCYFFSQGFCAKGDKCPFSHASPSIQNLKTVALQRPVKVAVSSAPESNEKPGSTFNGADVKSAKISTGETISSPDGRSAHVNEVLSNQKDGRTVSGAIPNGGSRGRADGPVVASKQRVRQVQPGDERVQNGIEPDEWWEESSPGFDVLVDNGHEQSRYPDDPDFQNTGEIGLDSGNVSSGNRGRGGRSIRVGEDMEQYEYDYPNMYEHPASYDGGVPYDHGGYEYNVHEQQGGYDLSGGYERSGHQRVSVYSERASTDEVMGRERLGMHMDVDMRSGGGAHDQRARIVKRRRADIGQQHVPENHGRRQRTEVLADEYHYQRQQEDQQKQHELHLRQQLFMQHGMRNSSRRGQEKSGSESAVIARRALHDIAGSDVPASALERIPQKTASRTRTNEHVRSGMKEADIHSRLSRVAESYGEAETRSYMDMDSSRKVEKEMKKEPSTFAGPKSLAQIRAEKRKGSVEEPSKSGGTSNGPKKPLLSASQLRGSVVRAPPNPELSVPVGDVLSVESLSVEERKTKRDKETQEIKKIPSFEGPKSLSVILEEKRKVDSGTDSKMEDSNIRHLPRLAPASRVVIASRVDSLPDADPHGPNVDTKQVNVGYAEVEDGEFVSEDDDGQRGTKDDSGRGRQSHFLSSVADGSQSVANRDILDQDNSVLTTRRDAQGIEDDDVIEEQNNGVGLEKFVEDEDYNDGQEGDEEGEEREDDVVPEQDDDGYGLDEEEDEDDFAKKLGGFFP